MDDPDYNELDDMLAELETAFQNIEDAPVSQPQDTYQEEQYDQQQTDNVEYQSDYYQETYVSEEQQYEDPSASNAGSYQQEQPAEVYYEEPSTPQQDIEPSPPVQPEPEPEPEPQRQPEPEPVVEVQAPRRPPPVPMRRTNSQPSMEQDLPSKKPVTHSESAPDIVAPRPNKPLPVPVKKEAPKPPPKPQTLDNSTASQPTTPQPTPPSTPPTRPPAKATTTPITRQPSDPPKSQPPVPTKRAAPSPPTKKVQEPTEAPQQTQPVQSQEVAPPYQEPAPYQETAPQQPQYQESETQQDQDDFEQRQRDLEERRRKLEEKKKAATLRRSTSIDSPPGSPTLAHQPPQQQAQPSPGTSPSQTTFGAVKPSNRTIRSVAELGRARSLIIDPESLKNSFSEQSTENKQTEPQPPVQQPPPTTQQTRPPTQTPPPSLQTPPPTLQTPPASLQTPPTQTTSQQTPPPYQATPPPYQSTPQSTPPPYNAPSNSSATMRHTPHVPQAIPPRRTQVSMDSIPLAALAALQQSSANAPAPAPTTSAPTHIALYNYKARGNTFSTGDVDLDMILNDTMSLVLDLKNGWLRVNLKGKTGLVPASYVRAYQPNQVVVPPRPTAQQPTTTPTPVAQAPAAQPPATQPPQTQPQPTQPQPTGTVTPPVTSPVPPRPVKATSPAPGRAPPPVTPRPVSTRTITEDESPTASPTTPVGSAPATPAETPNASPAPSPVPRRPAPPVPGASPAASPMQSPAQSPATPARPIPGRLQSSQTYPIPGTPPASSSPGKLPSSVSDIRNKIGANINLGAFKGSGPPVMKKLPSMGAIPLPKVQEPVEEVPRGRIRFARLIVSYIDLNNVSQQVEKKFPVVSAVSHVTGWCAKQFFGGAPAPTANQPKEAFGLFYNNKVLDPEKPLACFHNLFNIREPIQVELRKVKLEEVLCRVTTKEQDVSVTLKVTQFTSVWFVLMQTMKKMQAKSGETPENYRLYFESTNEDLDETELMFTYKDKLSERIICGMRGPLPGENHKINCLYNDLYSFDINPNSNTETLLRKLLKQEVVRRAHEAFHPLDLYLEFSNSSVGEQNEDDESSGEEEELLDEYTPFANYNRLFEQNLVEAKRRSKTYSVELDGIPYILSLDRNTTVEDVLNLIAFNSPDVLQGQPLTEFTLIVGEVPLLWDRTVQSYDIKDEPLAFRRKPKPVVVFLGEKSQATVEVDFTIHVVKILPAIFRAFGMTVPKKDSDFTLRRLSPDAPVEMTRSLAGQNIPMNATLILKMVEKQPVKTLVRGESDPNLGPNIYEEEANPTTIVMDSDEPNVVRGGTLNKLVEFITNPQTDIEFMKGFLMTYQSFTTAPSLLRKLIERFNVPLPSSSSEEYDNFEKGIKRPIQLRVCSTLKHWMENHWQDFDHDLTQQLVDFTDNLPHEEATIANQLRQAILKRTCGMKTRSRAGVIFTKNFPEPILKLPKKSAGEAIHILDYDELEIARQLSLIEFEYYQKILPTEFLGQCWSKQETQHLAPNLLNMIARSTALSLWISNMIVDPARVKTRAQRFTKLIKIAEHLRKLNNFSTLMAFLGAFNNASVSRLKFTKALVPKKQMDSLTELETVMSVESSSKNYRQALRSSNPPCIPYIGTYLSDLTFIDDGNKNNITDHNLINFGKRMLTHRVISEIQRYQQVGYSFSSVAQIVSHIKDLGIGDEKTFNSQLYEKSLAREPRGAEKVV